MVGKTKAAGKSDVSFFLNGEKITLSDPSPKMMLIDFLRDPALNLSGPKKPCGQGGCGGCTVVLSSKLESTVTHRAINSCLRPVTALNGLSVTTIEGTGSVDGKMNKVAYELAKNNGTQCGYCTNGWVMCMSGHMANKGGKKPTQREVENLFDGNICRCTGYRSILTGMKQLAKNPPKAMETILDPAFSPKAVRKDFNIPVPDGAFNPGPARDIQSGDNVWVEARTKAEIASLYQQLKKSGPVRLVSGNTSFGIYKDEIEDCHQFIDIRNVKGLDSISISDSAISVGAGVTYTQLLEALNPLKPAPDTPMGVMQFMAQRTAGHIVRNAASLGGNAMLVLKHIHQGEFFPSDMFTVLAGLNPKVTYFEPSKGAKTSTVLLMDLVNMCRKDPKLAEDLCLTTFSVRKNEKGTYWAQKVALREVNSHSIVNMFSNIQMQTINGTTTFGDCRFVFGGLLTYPVYGVVASNSIAGQPATKATMKRAAALLKASILVDIKAQVKAQPYLKDLPNEGFDANYRADLACKLLYKAYLNALETHDPNAVPKDEKSAAKRYWGNWPVSTGTEDWKHDTSLAPISQPYIKMMAMYQAQGEVRYTQETPVPANTLYAAVAGTTKATGRCNFVLPGSSKEASADDLRVHLADTFEGFVDLVINDDVPAKEGNPPKPKKFGAGGDQPLFLSPDEDIMYAGQAITLVLADGQLEAERIADYVRMHCVAYPKKYAKKPILDIDTALAADQVFPDSPASASYMNHIWKVKRPKSKMGWTSKTSAKLPDDKGSTAACTVVETTQHCGGQLHFYMETQTAIAEPKDGNTMVITSSTQSPRTVHSKVAEALDVDFNQVRVEVPQVGGAYGGKTEPSQIAGLMVAVAAHKHGVPVYLAVERGADSALIGGRHPYKGVYKLAVGNDPSDQEHYAKIMGLQGDLTGDGGAYYDCSFVVSDCIQLRIDSSYNVPNYQTTIDVVRTNKAPNTAYRAFGDIQGTLILENAIEEAAAEMKLDAATIRENSLYALNDPTPSGQTLGHCYQREVWDYIKSPKISDYDKRKKSVDKFNQANRWRKRGICLMPLKYGSGFNLVMLEQTTALVSIYPKDGTILIQQGGTDMGQGMVTQLAQIAAHVLGIPIELIRVAPADTSVIANPSSTGASTGTQYNGLAIKNACEMLKERLDSFCKSTKQPKVDKSGYWDATGKNWQHVVSAAFGERVNLQAQAKAVIPGGTKSISTDNISFKKLKDQPKGTGIAINPKSSFSEPVNEYVGFTYSAACAEVEVDILTGETKILRADIVHDMGRSLNPAIDIGQIEGAFVQGIGYLLTEQVKYQDSGKNEGQLNTVNTWRYKPPAVPTIPLEMNVRIFPGDNVPPQVWKDKNALYSSKEVGEPPMVLANSVFFALKSAIRAAREDQGLSTRFDLSAPATVNKVHEACWKDEKATWKSIP